MPRNDPWFWLGRIPYDEFVVACWIASIASTSSDGTDRALDHDSIIDMIWRYARGPSQRLRKGPTSIDLSIIRELQR